MPRKDDLTSSEHPDLVFGEAVYTWTGNLTFTRHNTRPVILLVEKDKNTLTRQLTEEEDGTEIVHYPGKCALCDEVTYAWKSGPHADAMLGNALAVFTPGGKNEPPIVYCQEHDLAGIEHRKKSGRLKPDQIDGTVVRLK